MKKPLSLLVMLSVTLTISAEKYQAFYDINTSSAANFTVQVDYDSVVIGNNKYTLRQLGTITNSGYTFNSYMYSNNERMFCVSTTTITVEASQGKTFLVTRIGCGIAGFKDADIAPLFAEAADMDNVVLPKSFCNIIAGDVKA